MLFRYFMIGADEVWVVTPDDRSVTVYHEPNCSQSFSSAETTELKARLLPGFSLALLDMDKLIVKLEG